MTTREIHPYPFQEKTLDALDAGKRFIAMMGGTGGGKSWWSPCWLAYVISRDVERGVSEGAPYVALAPTYPMIRDIIRPMYEMHYKGTTLEGHFHKSEDRYELPTGGNIYFRSGDRPERIEGFHTRGMTIDEPSEMKYSVWPIIRARTGMHRAPALFTGYPTNMGWYYIDIFKRWQSGDPEFEVIQFRSIDNPDYPKQEYERAKATLPGWLFDMRYDGKFRKPFGLVYPEFGPHCYVDPFEIPADWPVFIGLDPGVFFGALFMAWNDGIWHVFGEHYTEIVSSASSHSEAIRGLLSAFMVGGGSNIQGFIYDPSRVTDVTDLAEHGIGPLYPGKNAVLAGIATMTGAIKGNRFKVMRGRAPNFVDQMEKYRFPTDAATGNIAKENPLKKDDHLPDCARYVLHTIEGAETGAREEVLVYSDVQDISKY